MRQTTRDRAADLGLFLLAAVFSVITYDSVKHAPSGGALVTDQITGGLACAALFLRRRWPVQLAVVLLVIGSFAHLVTGPTLVALFTVATRRPLRTIVWVAALLVGPVLVHIVLSSGDGLPADASAITYFALVAGALSWGLFIRAQRQLVASLRERSARAVTEARRQAREDIAREMHDVLAHRLSLLSVHAGALEIYPGAPPEEVQRAARVIRNSAHQALQDLREIIGVLRAPEHQDRPQPVLDDLGRLMEESRRAGMQVVLEQSVSVPAPAMVGRTAYRVVQEGLTNTRKHAPDAPVLVKVSGSPDEGLTVEVRNPIADSGAATIPGAGRGLIGLAERAKLIGGRLECGRSGDDFRLHAWLPWKSDRDPAEVPVNAGR
jgi:signal transduction histidine kinase